MDKCSKVNKFVLFEVFNFEKFNEIKMLIDVVIVA